MNEKSGDKLSEEKTHIKDAELEIGHYTIHTILDQLEKRLRVIESKLEQTRTAENEGKM
jgi:hypothetical protein